jgi:hypothetical protein
MRKKRFLDLVLIVVALLALDWLIGFLITSDLLPLWVFLLPNLPFGAFYVWMESSWVGTRYEILGHRIGDTTALLVFSFTVIAQSLLYFALLELSRKKRYKPPTA